ncbi:MAG TPA: thermonuclease family protein [Stellaceae bacterium]|nr:thermonuclease family protein [Stellaceae bacterium]
MRFSAVLFLVIVAVFGGRALYQMERASAVGAAVALLESPPALAGTSGPLTAAGSDLPSVDVSARPVHVVPPDDGKPARPVTITGRAGAPDAHTAPPTTTSAVIKGPAKLAGGLSLTVGDRAIELFGVKAPYSGDRCAGTTQPSGNCGELARGALAARLKANAAVSCRVPPGQRRAVPAALCTDAAGVDLAGFLVAQGFALADPAQSYDYVGAETVARSQKRGLWRYR